MFAHIYGEEWAAAGQPALTEVHGRLVHEATGEDFGRIMSDDEERRVRGALLELWMQPTLSDLDH